MAVTFDDFCFVLFSNVYECIALVQIEFIKHTTKMLREKGGWVANHPLLPPPPPPPPYSNEIGYVPPDKFFFEDRLISSPQGVL